MSGFPLLDVPELVFDQVYRYFEVDELINLAQCSKTTKSIIRSMEKYRKGTEIDVLVGLYGTTVSVRLQNHRKSFVWHLRRRRFFPVEGKFITGFIDSPTWETAEINNGSNQIVHWDSDCLAGYFEEDTLAIVRAMKSIFYAQLSLTELSFGDQTDFDKLIIDTDTLRHSKRLVINDCAVDDSEMTFLLDHLVTEDLKMGAFPGKTFRYKKPINIPKIHIKCGKWVDPETFLRLSNGNREVIVDSAELISSRHLNRFLKGWVSGENKTLEMLSVSKDESLIWPHNRSIASYIATEVLEGIQTLPGSKKRPGTSRVFQKDCQYENGRDMRRADGVLATVLVQGPYRFKFTVWEDPNPNVPIEYYH